MASYLDSIERTYTMAKTLHVEGVMTPHIYWDGTLLKLDEINANGRTKPSQFIYGNATVLRQLAVARECSAAWLTKLDPTVVLPTWRVNNLAFVGDATPARVTAKLQNGWGALSGQQVKFQLEGTDASCVAWTDSGGVATCGISGFYPAARKVTAEFAGASTTDFVDLPSSSEATLAESGGNGGCTIGNGRFDPLLIGVAIMAAWGLVRRRGPSQRAGQA